MRPAVGGELGFGVRAFVHVTLARHSPDNSRRFAELVARTSEVQEAHALTGEADYLLKVTVRGLGDLAALINEVLLPARERGPRALRDRARDAEGDGGAAALTQAPAPPSYGQASLSLAETSCGQHLRMRPPTGAIWRP